MTTSWTDDADHVMQYRDRKRATADLPLQTQQESGGWLFLLLLVVVLAAGGAFLLFGGQA